MRVVEEGHVYELAAINPEGGPADEAVGLVFVKREGQEAEWHPGTQTQDVLRALIDRTAHCHRCLPHDVNPKIIYHLRMALVLHEARALERHVEKGQLAPENIATSPVDGHFQLTADPMLRMATGPGL